MLNKVLNRIYNTYDDRYVAYFRGVPMLRDSCPVRLRHRVEEMSLSSGAWETISFIDGETGLDI